MGFQEALPAVDPVAQAKAQARASRKSGIFQGVLERKTISTEILFGVCGKMKESA